MKQVLRDLEWIEELLPSGCDAAPKNGGMAYYLDMKLVLILVEKRDGGNEHKGVTYPFDLWNGFILPVEQKKQSAFFLKFAFLENHPANKDWLYIPADTEDFEEEVRRYLREIAKRNPLIGTPIKFAAPAKDKDPQADAQKKAPNKAVKKVPMSKKSENDFLLKLANKRKR